MLPAGRARAAAPASAASGPGTLAARLRSRITRRCSARTRAAIPARSPGVNARALAGRAAVSAGAHSESSADSPPIRSSSGLPSVGLTSDSTRLSSWGVRAYSGIESYSVASPRNERGTGPAGGLADGDDGAAGAAVARHRARALLAAVTVSRAAASAVAASVLRARCMALNAGTG